MELKANCKINLGLRVLRRRCEPHGQYDGFHDIETVMLPVPGLFDTVSITPCHTPLLEVSGAGVDCPPEKNICMRALHLMQREFGIGGARIALHKAIPTGAGLGGGSSDAAAVLRALNEEFELGLPDIELERLGAGLGSDVPFFIRGTPQLCTSRGEVMTPVEVDLTDKWLVILKPDVAVSTAEAYSAVTPREISPPRPDAGLSLAEIVRQDIGRWRELLVNDFEDSVFTRYPEIGALKDLLYDGGALYASMSGSGSAVFGIFASDPKSRLEGLQTPIFRHIEQLKS